MKLAALALAVCACSRTVDTASHLDLRQDVDTEVHVDAGVQAQEQGGSRETGTQAPTRITTIVDEYAVAPGEADHPPIVTNGGGGAPAAPAPALLRRTTTIEERGGRTWELDAWQSASMAGEEHIDMGSHGSTVAKADDTKLVKTDVGPPRWVWVFVPVVILGLLAGLLALAWKLKPAWLDWLWRLLRIAT